MLVIVSGVFRVTDAENLDLQTDRVMDALLGAEATSDGRITDSDVSATLSEGAVRISVVVDADSIDEAQRIGVDVIESAIVSAGGNILNAPAPTASASRFIEESRQAELVPA